MSRSLRILLLVHNVAGRGTYWRALQFGRHLVRRGHQATLVAISPRRRIGFDARDDQGVLVVEAPDLLWGPLRSGWDPWEAAMRSVWLRGRDFDLVHAFEARPNVLLPALHLQVRRRIPLVMDWCDWFGRGGSVEERPSPLVRATLRPVETYFEERFRTRADATTVICSTLRDKAIALGVPPETIRLVRNGCDVEGFRVLDRDRCRESLGLPAGAPIVGYVGAAFTRDAHLMARAFDRIHAAVPSARLLLIGYFNRGIEDMAGAGEAVIRTGPVDTAELNRYLAACDVCWLPLRDTGANRGRWPLKLNDYMAAGKPAVATAVGDVPEVIRAHEIGLVTRDTPEELALGVLALLVDPERRARLGRNARRAAEEAFDWRLKTAELENLYQHVLAG